MSVDGERKFTGILHDLTERVELGRAAARQRGALAVDHRIGRRRHRRDRLAGAGRGVQPGRRAPVRLRGVGGGRPERQDADAVAVPRGARRVPGPLSETGEAKIIGIGREVTGCAATARRFRCTCRSARCRSAGERKFTGILHDLSARVRMEEQLREQAALVRLGEMAAVIAHEVKNPLAGIRGAVQVIGGRLPTESREVAVIGRDPHPHRHLEWADPGPAVVCPAAAAEADARRRVAADRDDGGPPERRSGAAPASTSRSKGLRRRSSPIPSC